MNKSQPFSALSGYIIDSSIQISLRIKDRTPFQIRYINPQINEIKNFNSFKNI